MNLSPRMLQLVKDRRKTQHLLPAENAKPPMFQGRVYRARCVNAGWTAAELADHWAWAADEHPTRARAVVAYLSDPLEAALSTPAPLDITVLEVTLRQLGGLSQQDAQHHGFRFLPQLQNWWTVERGGWDPETLAWVVRFEVGDHRHLFDQARLLKATPGHHTLSAAEHQDYTDRSHLAMSGEPEAVDAKTLERFAAEGLVGHATRKRVELRRQHVRSATIKLRDAEKREDWDAYREALQALQQVAA